MTPFKIQLRRFFAQLDFIMNGEVLFKMLCHKIVGGCVIEVKGNFKGKERRD